MILIVYGHVISHMGKLITLRCITCSGQTNKMATGSVSDEWMYNEVLDEDLHSVRFYL